MTADHANEYTPLRSAPTETLNGNGTTSDNNSTNTNASSRLVVADCWAKYVAAVETHPLLTKSITAAIILGAADLAAQLVEFMRQGQSSSTDAIADEVNLPRTLRFAAIGLVGAPWSHYYFLWLDRCLPPTTEPWTKTTALKVCVDQFVQAPLLLAVMISALSLMKGVGLNGVKQDLEDTFVDALIANWKLWIPASLINMACVKPTLRVLFVNVVFFFWTIILSILLNKGA